MEQGPGTEPATQRAAPSWQVAGPNVGVQTTCSSSGVNPGCVFICEREINDEDEDEDEKTRTRT